MYIFGKSCRVPGKKATVRIRARRGFWLCLTLRLCGCLPSSCSLQCFKNLKPCNDNCSSYCVQGTLLSFLYKLIESSQWLCAVGIIKLILQGNWSSEMLKNLSTQQGNAGAGPSTQAVWLQQSSPFLIWQDENLLFTIFLKILCLPSLRLLMN